MARMDSLGHLATTHHHLSFKVTMSQQTGNFMIFFNNSGNSTNFHSSLDHRYRLKSKNANDIINLLILVTSKEDIEKMYRQINVSEEDWDFQRILWKNQTNEIVSYQLTTVTYGLACAPFLALRTLAQLVEDEDTKFPLAVPSMKRGRYVDDIFGGADTIAEAKEIVQQLNQLCMAGGFPLRKWMSNHTSVINSIPSEHRIDFSTIEFEDATMIHVLGLCWNPVKDNFQFSATVTTPKIITKRTVLSTIAKIFDPLGLLAPIIITAKIFIQELWSIKLSWDDTLPSLPSKKWTAFLEDLKEIPKLNFPRWIGLQSGNIFELHGFCDASQRAMCAAVYLRITTQDGNITTQLLCSKTKVAPLKRLTIPRLELSAAVLLTKLISSTLRILEINRVPLFMWTDSAITYTWLNNHPSRWKDFVHNRVCFIHETIPQAIWKFIPGAENPADCATRGLTPSQLLEYSPWWSGPRWLAQEPSVWPQISQIPSHKENLEERPTQVFVTNIKSNILWDLIYRYSNLTHLLRITALCMRAIARFKRTQNSSLNNPITTQEIEIARIYWVKSIQRFAFPQEIKILVNGNPLPRSSPLLRIAPYIDASGLLRVGGRLEFSRLPENAKHPLVLPRESPLSSLIIEDAHRRTMHGGTQLTLSHIRNNYWIIGGRAPIRSFILKCVRCARHRQQRAQQIMGQLPPERLTSSRPFLHSGVDYAGPFLLKNWRGRNSRTYKAYIALFVCHATSAIHLELVTDCTTDAFIAAFKRFTSRRGICSTLMSDCGTNLKGASSELKTLFSAASSELGRLATLLANDGTQWRFNPPSAPHFGGKWEAGVKSVKHHFKRVLGNHLLTYEEMNTFLTQIEAVLNSRPLCALTNDPDDFK
ncbi:uncharacterized protein LOC118646920 [Monomorium pharaonis]|uniref:uncharacterized protein LOC118646920 n=1 Tax=Monomorium pharaonis TaxID=307658 RepID=UPI001746C199|nr:uncharacterized protein LOC118646920 [Monomorium pharaonis]